MWNGLAILYGIVAAWIAVGVYVLPGAVDVLIFSALPILVAAKVTWKVMRMHTVHANKNTKPDEAR